MKITKTTTGIRLQASTARENAIIAVMVELLTLAPSTTADEAERHSVQVESQVDPSATCGVGSKSPVGCTAGR